MCVCVQQSEQTHSYKSIRKKLHLIRIKRTKTTSMSLYIKGKNDTNEDPTLEGNMIIIHLKKNSQRDIERQDSRGWCREKLPWILLFPCRSFTGINDEEEKRVKLRDEGLMFNLLTPWIPFSQGKVYGVNESARNPFYFQNPLLLLLSCLLSLGSNPLVVSLVFKINYLSPTSKITRDDTLVLFCYFFWSKKPLSYLHGLVTYEPCF